MFVGHFGVAFAGKKVAPTVPLPMLLVAAILADILWVIFLSAGIEHVAIRPGIMATNSLDLYDFALSHSLATDLVWAALLAVFWYVYRRNGRGAWVLFVLVMSHWVLDFISHRPDMPIAPGLHRYFGLALWNSWLATLVVEGGLWVAGIALYLSATRARNSTSMIGFWFFVVLLTVAWLDSLKGTPPPSIRALNVSNAVFLPILLLWAWWMERTRPAVPDARSATTAS